jgi:hypothetical protein
MNILKKILSVLIIFSISYINTFANIDTKNEKILLIEQIHINSIKLNKIRNGKKYEQIIKKYVEKISLEKAEKLKTKLSKIKIKLANKNDVKSKKLKIVINYLEAVLDLKMYLLSQKKLEEFKNNISEKDKKIIEKEIIKIQLNLLNNTNNLLKKVSSEFEKYSQYEEK